MQSLIEACNVTDAKLAYEILTKGNVEISSELKQEYLEMLCFHNSNDEELEEDYNDYKGTLQDQPSRWVTGNFLTTTQCFIDPMNWKILSN